MAVVSEKPAKHWDIPVKHLPKRRISPVLFTAETMSKLCNALGVSADYILFGTESQNDLSAIHAMLSGLNPEYLPLVEQLLSAYIQSIQLSQK